MLRATASRPALLRVTLPPLHGGQQTVARDAARFRVITAGRRWGKTRLGSLLCVTTALDGRRAWWVAPSYPVASVGWREVKRLARQIPGVTVREVDRIALFPTGGWVQVRSADNPDSLRGEGLDFAVLDECAYIREEAWQEALRPALSDRRGRALFISTPAGRNWFWRLWQRGQDTTQSEWRSWRFPSIDNPYLHPREIEAARLDLPEQIFQQEYLAAFIEDGGVFRHVVEAATATAQAAPWPTHSYVMGADFAKHQDFTALVVIDATTREVVAVDRFNQIDYATQVGRLRALYDRFKPVTVVAERNSMGEPVIEQLQRGGMRVTPFTTTSASKSLLMDALQLAFETRSLRILNDAALVGELQAYQAERLPGGMLRYGAPDGMHDDMVMALALAWHGVTHQGGVAVTNYRTA